MSLIYPVRHNLIAAIWKSNFYSFFSGNYTRPLVLSYMRNCSTVKKQTTSENSAESSENLEVERSELEKDLFNKVEALTQEVEIIKDKYQRTLADRENVRLRLEKQVQDSKLFGIQSFCKDLLDVSDVFRKAIESVPEEKKITSDIHFKQLYDGVVMTENQLLSVFRRHGLEQIIPKEGEKFDPSFQEAMFELPTDDKVPGTIGHVVRGGWKLHNRCIRSAQVGVFKY